MIATVDVSKANDRSYFRLLNGSTRYLSNMKNSYPAED